MNKKLAFIMPGTKKTAANRYRFLQYTRFLDGDGIDYDLFWPHTNNMDGTTLSNKIILFTNVIRLVYYLLFRKYSNIFIQRFIIHPKVPIEYFLPRYLKKKLILDIDDSVFLLSPNKYSLILKSVSKVIAGSLFLKNYCEKFSEDVIVVPTSVDIDKIDHDKRVQHETNDELTFGWVGSPSGMEYIKTLHNALKTLNKIIPIRLIVVSDFTLFDKVQIPGLHVTNIQWQEDKEYEYFKLFDVGILPLNKDDEFVKGKCSFKAIQYMANKVPVLSENVGNNSKVIRSGVNGYLYNDEKEFISLSLNVLSKPKKINEMVKVAYEDILKYYSLEKNYKVIKFFVHI